MKYLVFLLIIITNISLAQENRYLSLHICSDRFLQDFARADEIVGLSWMSFDETYSYNIPKDKSLHVKPKLEEIIKRRPTKVFTSDIADYSLIRRLKEMNIELQVIDSKLTWQEIFQQILHMGNILNNPIKAAEIYEQTKVSYENLQNHKNLHNMEQFLWLGAGSNTVGSNEYAHYNLILQVLGFANQIQDKNIAFKSISIEDIINLSPKNVIYFWQDASGPSLARLMMQHDAIKKLNFNTYNLQVKDIICADRYMLNASTSLWQQYKELKN